MANVILMQATTATKIEGEYDFKMFTGNAQMNSYTLRLRGTPDAADYIEFLYLNGTSWVPIKQGGIAVRLDTDTNHLSFTAPLKFKISKPVTVNAIGVELI